ncbi:MAG: hypothetical protein M3375_08380, partial [Actinomycetota bacterium]|nr:hypothetical protein [Actinomycetota bacterium]
MPPTSARPSFAGAGYERHADLLVEQVRAIQVNELGGPEVLELREVDEPEVPRGAELVQVRAAGVNYADTHQVENSYLAEATLPMIPLACGGDPSRWPPGGGAGGGGGYAERAVVYP